MLNLKEDSGKVLVVARDKHKTDVARNTGIEEVGG